MYVYKSIIVFLFFVRNGCLADKTYFSKWIKTDFDYPWKVYIFETLLGKGLNHCIENCKAKKMCDYINFNVESDACFLVGVNSIPESLDYSLNDRIETKKGYLLGKKQDWNSKTYNICSECQPYGVCKQDKPPTDKFNCQTYSTCEGDEQPENKYTACQNSGCGPPDNKPFTVVKGNMFSIGDKIKYECQKGYTDVSGGTGIVICQSSGIWSSTAIKCEPKVNGTTCSEDACYLLYKSRQTWHDGKVCKEEKQAGKLHVPITSSVERAAYYTCASESTLYNYQKEQKVENVVQRKRRSDRVSLDSFDRDVVTRTVQEILVYQKRIPTVKNIRQSLQEKIHYKGGERH